GGAVASLPEHELAAFCAVSSKSAVPRGAYPHRKVADADASNSRASGCVGGCRVGVPCNGSTSHASPIASAGPAGPPLRRFHQGANGDWVAKKDVMVPGPGGMMQLKAGRTADDELQQRLDDQ